MIKLEKLNEMSLNLVTQTSKCLGGDYLVLMQEISEV
jgi:hypothetical protein